MHQRKINVRKSYPSQLQYDTNNFEKTKNVTIYTYIIFFYGPRGNENFLTQMLTNEKIYSPLQTHGMHTLLPL
jgi:hypothetical protein